MNTPEETAPAAKTKRKPASKPRRKTAAKKSPARKPSAKKKSNQAARLRELLADFSEKTTAEFGKARAASQKAIHTSLSGWKKLETRRKVEFVAALLAALAAATGVVAGARRRK